MSYQVLARKWRPRTFRELVGQDHVVRVLVNALDHDRLHHALLFTGTRGVGKTTLSRIFAKSLNCEQGVTSAPCGQCSACRAVDEGRFVDLIEVDAASRTKVEDTRELLENVQYAPTRGRYKVYLIDEVHMLSNHSFNALLKTLEEPPPHIKFLLATTDPQRLPVTILSRCLQFNLKRLPASLIANYLDNLLEQEGIERESPALALIARAGDGSMRDALSLLDQAIAFGGGRIRLQEVSEMLGTIDQRQVVQLVDALAAGDAKAILQRIAELDLLAPDYHAVMADLISLLQRVALVQAVPDVIDDSVTEPEVIRRLADAITPEDIQLFYQIALIGRRDLSLSPDSRGGFEMVMLRMLCFRPSRQGEQLGPASINSTTVPAAKSAAGMAQTIPASGQTSPTKTAPLSAIWLPTPQQGDHSSARSETDWNAIVAQLGLKGIAQQLALNCVLQGREGDAVYLVLEPGHAHMRTRNAEEYLKAALKDYYGETVRLHIRIGDKDTLMPTPARQQAEYQAQQKQAALNAIHEDATVQTLCKTFNGQVKPDSITPID